jgi:hypothetical protein
VSAQYVFFGSGAHMSADLKRVTARVRAAKPEYFTPRNVRQSSMDKDGKVLVTESSDVRAVAMSPAVRHRFSTERK